MCYKYIRREVWLARLMRYMSGSSSMALCARNAHITVYDVTTWRRPFHPTMVERQSAMQVTFPREAPTMNFITEILWSYGVVQTELQSAVQWISVAFESSAGRIAYICCEPIANLTSL